MSSRFLTLSILLLCVFGVLLSGCTREERAAAVDGFVSDSVSSSGSLSGLKAMIMDIIGMGKDTVSSVQTGVQEIHERVNAVKEGVEKLQEGKALIEEGLGVGDEEL